ncbi:hypothetical protein Tco_0463201 [Tanacetum coccineum]
MIITESSIRSNLHLEDQSGIELIADWLLIFEEASKKGTIVVQATHDAGGRFRQFLLILKIDPHFYSTIILWTSEEASRRKQRRKLKFLDLEKAKDAQAKEIAGLKKRVQKLERKKKSRTTGLKRLRKVGESSRVESSEDKKSLGAQEDASKQGRIVDETQGRSDDAKMFDADDLHGDEVDEREIDEITPIGGSNNIIDELTWLKLLIEIKAAKPKTKDIGKAIMIEPEVPLKRKDQVALDEEMARNLEAQLQAELIEEEKMARKKEEEANIAPPL